MFVELLFLLSLVESSDTTLFKDSRSLIKRSWTQPNVLQENLKRNNPPQILTLPAKKVTRIIDSENLNWKPTQLPFIYKQILKPKEDTKTEEGLSFLENPKAKKQMEENTNLCDEIPTESLKELKKDMEENKELNQTQDEDEKFNQLTAPLKMQEEERDLEIKDRSVAEVRQALNVNDTHQVGLEEKIVIQLTKKIELLKFLIFKTKEHEFQARPAKQKYRINKYFRSIRAKNSLGLTNRQIDDICGLICNELADTPKSIYLYVVFLLFMNDKSKIFEVKNPIPQQSELRCKNESFKDTLEKINQSIQEWKGHKFRLITADDALSCLISARNSLLQGLDENSTLIEDLKYQLDALYGLLVLLNKGGRVY